VLKPIGPLPFSDKERLTVKATNTPVTNTPPDSRKEEMVWIGENADMYKGQWIAVEGSRLVGHESDLATAERQSFANGASHPLFFSVPEQFGESSVEWI
jgi:hypothetical protein